MLQCTRPWPGIWSIFFVWGVEKPKTQSPADIARVKVGSFGWDMMPCWAGCDVQQEGRHQRAKGVREEIITRSGRFMDKVFGGEGLVSLKVLHGGPSQQGRHIPWCDTGLQPHHISLRLPKVKALWDGFQLPAGSGRPGWQKGKAGLNGDCVVLCVSWRAEGKAVILPQLSDKWTSLQNYDYHCHMNAHWESFSADKNTLCVRSNFTLKASSREQDTVLTAVEMEHVTGLGYQGTLLKVLSQLFPLLCRHCSVF